MIHGGPPRHIGHGITGARRGRSAGTHGGVHHGHGAGARRGHGVRPGLGAGVARAGVPVGDPVGTAGHGVPATILHADVSQPAYATVIPASVHLIPARPSTMVATAAQAAVSPVSPSATIVPVGPLQDLPPMEAIWATTGPAAVRLRHIRHHITMDLTPVRVHIVRDVAHLARLAHRRLPHIHLPRAAATVAGVEAVALVVAAPTAAEVETVRVEDADDIAKMYS